MVTARREIYHLWICLLFQLFQDTSFNCLLCSYSFSFFEVLSSTIKMYTMCNDMYCTASIFRIRAFQTCNCDTHFPQGLKCRFWAETLWPGQRLGPSCLLIFCWQIFCYLNLQNYNNSAIITKKIRSHCWRRNFIDIKLYIIVTGSILRYVMISCKFLSLLWWMLYWDWPSMGTLTLNK